MIASGGSTSRVSERIRSGRIGQASDTWAAAFCSFRVCAVGCDLREQFVAWTPRRGQPAGDPDEHGERSLEVGERADLERVVAAQLGGIDVDLHELGGGDVERVLGVPGAGVGFGEPGAEGEDPVRGARGLS